jgi:transposase
LCPGGRGSPDLVARPRKYPRSCSIAASAWCLRATVRSRTLPRDLGVPSETLRKYVRQVEADEGGPGDRPTTAEREEIKQVRKEVYELRRANEILKSASVFFAKELDEDRTR